MRVSDAMSERLSEKAKTTFAVPPPHPALRATFSPRGEGDSASSHCDRNFGRGTHGVAVGADDVGGGG
ncbi:hypothetical protein GGE12_002187 [Rhizobium mongolense]|uniref:Uncharacterized protein n=1 Tax=Rhizobium mongolense TaxID=57676 RepID=A0A7W6RM46_9HYPH|nr:hypothetical protein [Rhizobium mongolense]